MSTVQSILDAKLGSAIELYYQMDRLGKYLDHRPIKVEEVEAGLFRNAIYQALNQGELPLNPPLPNVSYEFFGDKSFLGKTRLTYEERKQRRKLDVGCIAQIGGEYRAIVPLTHNIANQVRRLTPRLVTFQQRGILSRDVEVIAPGGCLDDDVRTALKTLGRQSNLQFNPIRTDYSTRKLEEHARRYMEDRVIGDLLKDSSEPLEWGSNQAQ